MKVGNWADIDSSLNPDNFIDFLDRCSENEQIRLQKRRCFELLDVQPGHCVLNAGCGTGEDVNELGGLVGTQGAGLGIDKSASMIQAAKSRHQSSTSNIDYRVEDIYDLQLRDGSFDRCCADRVFQHLTQPKEAVLELSRVLKPGGLLVISEPDWCSLVVDSQAAAMTDILVESLAQIIPNHDIAARLPQLLSLSGLTVEKVITAELEFTDLTEASAILFLEAACKLAVANGRLSKHAAQVWYDGLVQRDKSGDFSAGITGVAVLAKKCQ